MLKHFGENWGEGYRAIIDCLVEIPFLENWGDVSIEPVVWEDHWNIFVVLIVYLLNPLIN